MLIKFCVPGVPLSHMNMVAEVITSCDLMKKQMAVHAPEVEIRTIAHLPTAHIAGMQGYMVNPFYMGGMFRAVPSQD